MSYISRDGILKDLQEELELDSIYYNDDVNKGITEGLKLAIKNIKRFPTADVVEVRHGEWKDDNRLTHSAKFRCSVCDGLAYFPQPTRDKTWKRCCPYKYCPNCGAKMDGERREE